METIQASARQDLLNISRQTVLNAGYRIVVLKSKLRKQVVNFKKKVNQFYF